jgi:hypothetical protein
MFVARSSPVHAPTFPPNTLQIFSQVLYGQRAGGAHRPKLGRMCPCAHANSPGNGGAPWEAFARRSSPIPPHSPLILPRHYCFCTPTVLLCSRVWCDDHSFVCVRLVCRKNSPSFRRLGSCGEPCIEPVCSSRLCGCDTDAFFEALANSRSLNSVASSNLCGKMAVRHRLTLESRLLGHTVTSCCSRALATTRGEKGEPTAAPGQTETLWRQFFSDPSQWWDCRSEKVNPRYPDFKHKKRSTHSGSIIEETHLGWEQS